MSAAGIRSLTHSFFVIRGRRSSLNSAVRIDLAAGAGCGEIRRLRGFWRLSLVDVCWKPGFTPFEHSWFQAVNMTD
jgi:hypothetical protein